MSGSKRSDERTSRGQRTQGEHASGRADGKRGSSSLLFVFLGVFVLGVAVSFVLDVPVGIRMAENFLSFSSGMVLVLPTAFILIGLFEVWVPRETVERHLGEDSGRLLAWVWMILLAGTTVGGLYVAFPVAWALRRKGARLGLVFSYVELSGVCRIPMTLFEISFMGVPFTVIRYLVSGPLVILFSEILDSQLSRRGYRLSNPASRG